MLMRMLIGVLLCALLIPAVSWAAPGSADVFTADYSTRAGNWETYTANNANHTFNRVAGGGPHGIDCLELTFLTSAYDYGLGSAIYTLGDPGLGTARYYRYFEYHDPTNNWLATAAAPSTVWRFKRLMIADPANPGDRMILNTNAEAGAAHIEVIFDGSTVGSSGNIAKGVWHAIQVEVIYNSGTPSTVKVWVDNDTYASPDISVSYTVTNLPPAANRDDISYGAYTNHGLDTGGIYIMRESAFRVATTFDSNWNGWRQNGDAGPGSSGTIFNPTINLRRSDLEILRDELTAFQTDQAARWAGLCAVVARTRTTWALHMRREIPC